MTGFSGARPDNALPFELRRGSSNAFGKVADFHSGSVMTADLAVAMVTLRLIPPPTGRRSHFKEGSVLHTNSGVNRVTKKKNLFENDLR